MLIIYKIDGQTVEYADRNNNHFHLSVNEILERQLIDYFSDIDKVRIIDALDEKEGGLNVVVNKSLFGSYSVYRVNQVYMLSIFRCAFFMCMLVSVLLAGNKIDILNLNQPGGILFFCLSFVFIDTIGQVFGYKCARDTIYLNAILMTMTGCLIWATNCFEMISSDAIVSAYQLVVFDHMVKLCFINALCSVIADQFNSFIFYYVKGYTQDKGLWLRSLLSTISSQFIFTIIWISMFKYETLFDISTYIFIVSNFEIKIIAAIALLPLLYLLVKISIKAPVYKGKFTLN